MEPKKSPSADVHLKRPLLFSISMVLSLSLVITAFEWKTRDGKGHIAKTFEVRDVEEMLEIPPTEQLPPPPQRIQPPAIVEVPDEEEITTEIELVFDNEILAETPVEAVRVDTSPEEEESTDEIFLIVESPPQFNGGQTGLNKYVVDNLRYPNRARRMGVQGKVYVKAVIEKDGSLSNAEVLKGISLDCDEEALRVINASPKWIPGKQRGRAVRTSVVIPIIFML